MQLTNIFVQTKAVFSSRVAKDSILQFTFNVFGAGFSFLQLPLLLKLLGGQGFGDLVLFQTVVCVVSALTIVQFYQGMLKFAPSNINSEAIIQTMFRIGILNELISVAIIVLLVLLFPQTVISKFHFLSSNCSIGVILAIAVATVLPLGQTFATLLRLRGKFQFVVIVGAISSILRFFMLLSMPLYHFSIGSTIGWSFIVPELIRILALLFISSPLTFIKKVPPLANLKEILKFSYIVTIQEWCDLPGKQFDKIILSFFVQPVQIGIYQILRRIGTLMTMVVTPFSTSFFHEFSERINRNNISGAMKLFEKSTIAFSGISTLLALGLLLSKKIWVPRLFGSSPVDSHLVLLVIGIYIVVNGFNSVHTLLYSLGGIKTSFYITLASNTLFFVLALYLGSKYLAFGLVTAFGIQVLFATVAKLIVIYRIQKTRLLNAFVE